MLLTKAQVLRVEKRVFKNVLVEELGGEVRLGSLSAGAALQLKELGVESGGATQKLALVVFTSSIVDEKNEPLLTEDEAVKLVNTISVETLNFIITQVMALGKGKGSPKEAPAVATNGATDAEVPVTPNPSTAAQGAASPSA